MAGWWVGAVGPMWQVGAVGPVWQVVGPVGLPCQDPGWQLAGPHRPGWCVQVYPVDTTPKR
jgi:hypothetical protein